MSTLRNPDTIWPDEARIARDEAWETFLAEYLGCVDDDPGDARVRYFKAIKALENDRG